VDAGKAWKTEVVKTGFVATLDLCWIRGVTDRGARVWTTPYQAKCKNRVPAYLVFRYLAFF